MALPEALRHLLRREKPGQSLPTTTEEEHSGGSEYHNEGFSSFQDSLRAAADQEIYRRTLATLPEIEKAAPDARVLISNIFAHYGRDNAMIDTFLFREGATPEMVGSALGLGPSAIDRETFESLQSGQWYLAKSTQHYGEPIVTVVSNKPLEPTQLLSGPSSQAGSLQSGV